MVTAMCALAALVVTWSTGSGSLSNGAGQALLTACLVVAIVLSYEFPIHVRYGTGLHIATAALFLVAVLFPPPVAAAAAGLGVLGGNIAIRSRRGLSVGEIASDAGRWILIVSVGSITAHSVSGDTGTRVVSLGITVAVLWLGDVATIPLLLSPSSSDTPGRVAFNYARTSALAQGAQYLVGLLGAFEADEQRWALMLLFLPTVLVYLSFKSAKEMREGTRVLLEAMADSVDLRDPNTGGHSRRVTDLTTGIIREMGRHGPEADMIVAAARVHDIGKIGVPDEILLKPGPLTPLEYRVMQSHAEKGADLLARYPEFVQGAEIVRHHHERWDGRGYPDGLGGTSIPFGSRVIAVADAFDAMTSDRPYRRGIPADQAATILREGRGRQWDPVVVDIFLAVIADQLDQPVTPLLHMLPEARASGDSVG
jgi:hypothetical protein